MKFLKFLWTIVWNLLFVVITLAILDKLEYQEGSQEIAALAFIIIATLQNGFSMQLRMMTIFATTSQIQNAKILRQLGNIEEADYLDKDSETLTQKIKENEIKFWINLIGAGIVWLISGLTLLGNL